MDRILNRICSIDDHPISFLDRSFKEKYVKGLGACLYKLSNNSPIVNMYFNVWAKCIINDTGIEMMWRDDLKAIKSAISIQRKGIKFFTMKYPFFFDVFYLLQSAQKGGYNPSLSDKIQAFFKNEVCGMFTKSAMMATYAMFQSNSPCADIPVTLIHHRDKNEKILKSKEKKILVVANVSAGKSTLINALVGYRLNRTKTTACTSRLALLYNKLIPDGITIYAENDKYFYFDDIESVNSDTFINAALPFNSTLSRTNICFIDTPGINNSNDIKHRMITEDAIKSGDYDAVVYVSNCQYFGTTDEHSMLLVLKKYVKAPIIFVLNQLDRFKQKEDSVAKMLKDYKEDLQELGFKTPIICPLSAQAALLFKLSDDKLDEDDKYDKDIMRKKFSRDYYNLASYVVGGDSHTMLDKTGITYLETQILNVI